MNIGEKIYNLRKKKNMSQEDLASVLNVSRQTISKWETGESNPDIDKIVPLCNFFEISTDESFNYFFMCSNFFNHDYFMYLASRDKCK